MPLLKSVEMRTPVGRFTGGTASDFPPGSGMMGTAVKWSNCCHTGTEPNFDHRESVK